MIDDGYTFHYKDFFFRPLARFGREVAKEHFDRRNWAGLGAFLWNPPHFIGSDEDIDEEDQKYIFSVMMDYDTESNFRNLERGVSLILRNPRLAMRTCAACKKWWFDHDTGLVSRNENGLLLRPAGTVLPCETREGCEKGHFDNPLELNSVNSLVWQHYREWKAVGLTDEAKSCPIVRRNWAIIDRLVEQHGFPSICN